MNIIFSFIIWLVLLGYAEAQNPPNISVDTQKNSYLSSVLAKLSYDNQFTVGNPSYNLAKYMGFQACRSGKTLIKLDSLLYDSAALILRKDKDVFIVFRGTNSIKDAISDVDYFVIERPDLGDKVMVHKGFNDISTRFISGGLLDHAKHCLSGGALYIVGHSLGGAVANLFALEALYKGIPIKAVITFGAPRVGGPKFCKLFDRKFRDKSFQWIHPHDPIPGIPKGPLQVKLRSIESVYKSVFHEPYFQSLNQVKLGKTQVFTFVKETLNPFDGKSPITYHRIKNYAYDLWDMNYLSQKFPAKFSPINLLYDGKCDDQRECQAHERCSTRGENKCVPQKRCKSNRDCDSHQFCDVWITESCENLRTKGTRCVSDKQCKSKDCSLFSCR